MYSLAISEVKAKSIENTKMPAIFIYCTSLQDFPNCSNFSPLLPTLEKFLGSQMHKITSFILNDMLGFESISVANLSYTCRPCR